MNARRWIWRVLGIIGLMLVVAGSIIWGVAAAAIDRAQSLYWASQVISGSAKAADVAGTSAANVWQWVGIATLATGVALLVTVAIVFAVTTGDRAGTGFRLDLDGARFASARGGRASVDATSTGGPDPAGAAYLAELVAMHDRGVLTDIEFAAAKRRLLGLCPYR